MQDTLAIDAKNLARRYGRRWALADVSLRIPHGRIVMVAGRNGSGKSTLFRILSTAIRPDHGSANILGFDLVKERYDVRKGVALLSHYSYLYESLTAAENLQVVAEHRGLSKKGLKELLDRVRLGPRANDPVHTFSAGMRKRLSFARVLLQQPRLVLLDEPYGQLDPEGFALVDEVVHELQDFGVTVLIATHQLERGGRIAEDALVLEQGRLVWQGDPQFIPSAASDQWSGRA
jgi:heme exporter protein A